MAVEIGKLTVRAQFGTKDVRQTPGKIQASQVAQLKREILDDVRRELETFRRRQKER